MQTKTLTLFATDAEQLSALRAPFPVTEIRKREQSGKELSFYEHYTIQNRLLDIFGSGVSLTTGTTSTDKDTNTVHVEVLLEVEWVSGKKSRMSGWGTSAIMKSGDHFKSAYSDAVKVTLTKLGCGLELYDPRYRDVADARLREIQDQEAEMAFLTCQICSNTIEAGSRPKPDGTVFEQTAKEVATSTRNKFGRRLCMACAKKAAKDAASMVMAS